MANMPWVKVYTEILDDVKMSRLSERVKWRFVQLILLAGECDANGALSRGDSALTCEDIAWRLRLDARIVQEDLQTLEQSGLIHRADGAPVSNGDLWIVTRFAERNPRTHEEQQERWREYQRKRRKKEENVINDSLMTPPDMSLMSQPLRVEEDKESDKDIESTTTATGGRGKLRGRVISEMDASRIYMRVTGQMAVPSGGFDEILRLICDIANTKGEFTEKYIRGFWEQWVKRGHSPLNWHWLDWAASGVVPPGKVDRKNGASAATKDGASKVQRSLEAIKGVRSNDGDTG